MPALMQLFILFDLKKNNVVDFDEFVRALSVFHPKAPLEEKAECAFPPYPRATIPLACHTLSSSESKHGMNLPCIRVACVLMCPRLYSAVVSPS